MVWRREGGEVFTGKGAGLRLSSGVAPVVVLVVEIEVISGGVHVVEHRVQSPAEGDSEEDQGQDAEAPLAMAQL
jgi:hypothetical protein